MKRHLVSVLIGLLSLASIYTGVSNQLDQNDIKSIETEKNVVTDESNKQVLETEELEIDSLDENIKDHNSKEVIDNIVITEEVTEEVTEEATTDSNNTITNNDDSSKIDETTQAKEKEDNHRETEKKSPQTTSKETDNKTDKKQTVENEKSKQDKPNKQEETNSAKQEKVVKVDSKEKLKSFYNELNTCEDSTVYKKVIINGKEYKSADSDTILKDIVSRYGVDLVKLDDTKANQEKKVEEPTKATEAPIKPKEVEPIKAPQSGKSSYANQVLELVNIERAKKGLSALTTDSKLTAAANHRAVEIVDRFDHTRPNGQSFFTVFDEFGIFPQTGGENIAYGQRTPEEVVNAWMNSSGHRANILSGKFNKLGVGVHEKNGTIYWSQLFTG